MRQTAGGGLAIFEVELVAFDPIRASDTPGRDTSSNDLVNAYYLPIQMPRRVP